MTTDTDSILNPVLRNAKNNLRRLLQTAINLDEAKVKAEEKLEEATRAYRLTLAAFAEAKERRDNVLASQTELEQIVGRRRQHLEDKIDIANFRREGLWRSSLNEDEVAFLEAIRNYASAIRNLGFVHDLYKAYATQLSAAKQKLSDAEATLSTIRAKNTQAGCAVSKAEKELANLRKQPPISEEALFQAQRELVLEAGRLERIVDKEDGTPGWKCKAAEELILVHLRTRAPAPTSVEQTETVGDNDSIDFHYTRERDRLLERDAERSRRLADAASQSHSVGPND